MSSSYIVRLSQASRRVSRGQNGLEVYTVSSKRVDNCTVDYEEFTVKRETPLPQVFASTRARGERHVPPEPGRVERELSMGLRTPRVVPVHEP